MSYQRQKLIIAMPVKRTIDSDVLTSIVIEVEVANQAIPPMGKKE